MPQTSNVSKFTGEALPFTVRFDAEPGAPLSQDQEWCIVRRKDGREQRIRFHDYGAIYMVPDLCEHLFYDKLDCRSPSKVVSCLVSELAKAGQRPEDLSVLDVGAGNGMVGQRLSEAGVRSIVGVDILSEARLAARRDRPGLYKEYFAADLTALPPEVRSSVESENFGCMTTVAALGFGDIPTQAFAAAFGLVSAPGWVAFNIKEKFLDDVRDDTGFAGMVHRMIDGGVLEVKVQERYQHRLSTSGQPLHYVAVVGVKRRELPAEMVGE